MFVEERERLVNEVTVKLLSHVVLDIARHADQYVALQEKEESADQTRGENLAGGDCELRPGNFGPVCVNSLSDDVRNEESYRNTGEYA
jgi:hypothetical protein